MKSPYTENYKNHYLNIDGVYPSVLALKFFLGKNPELNFRNVDFTARSILDIGFGDARDLVLFNNLGFDTYGIEVDQTVVNHTIKKLNKINININLSKGFNDEININKDDFDFIYGNASLMYLKDENSSIQKTLSHLYSKINVNGYLLGNFTRFDSHITKDAKRLDNNRIIVKDPFFKQRDGQLYWLHNSKNEALDDLFETGFKNCKVFDFDVDWFGTRETHYVFFAQK